MPATYYTCSRYPVLSILHNNIIKNAICAHSILYNSHITLGQSHAAPFQVEGYTRGRPEFNLFTGDVRVGICTCAHSTYNIYHSRNPIAKQTFANNG